LSMFLTVNFRSSLVLSPLMYASFSVPSKVTARLPSAPLA
jgi:hypothetical protein